MDETTKKCDTYEPKTGETLPDLENTSAELRHDPRPEFVPFPKIARLSRQIVITEKLDGTNAQIFITEDGQLIAGSRTRWITPKDDNYGFAKWVAEHESELLTLGPGAHFGEWWGGGVQRGYGLLKGEKRFSLFNVGRWNADNPPPACCHVVPVLYSGPFDQDEIESCLDRLRDFGSVAAPGFMKPEGIIIYHAAAKTMLKKTLEKDEQPKGVSEAA